MLNHWKDQRNELQERRTLTGLREAIHARLYPSGAVTAPDKVDLTAAEEVTLSAGLRSRFPAARTQAIEMVPSVRSLHAIEDSIVYALLATQSEADKVSLLSNGIARFEPQKSQSIVMRFCRDSNEALGVRRCAIKVLANLEFESKTIVAMFQELIAKETASVLLRPILHALSKATVADLSLHSVEKLFSHDDIVVVAQAMKLSAKILASGNPSIKYPLHEVVKGYLISPSRDVFLAQLHAALRSLDAGWAEPALELIAADAGLADRMRKSIFKVKCSSHPDVWYRRLRGDDANCRDIEMLAADVFSCTEHRRQDRDVNLLKTHALGVGGFFKGQIPVVRKVLEQYFSRNIPERALWSDLLLAVNDPARFYTAYSKKYGDGPVGGSVGQNFFNAARASALIGPLTLDAYDAFAQCFIDGNPSVREHAAARVLGLGGRINNAEKLALLFPSGEECTEKVLKVLLMASLQPKLPETISIAKKAVMSGVRALVLSGIHAARLAPDVAAAMRGELTLVGFSDDAIVRERARAVLSQYGFNAALGDDGESGDFFAFRRTG